MDEHNTYDLGERGNSLSGEMLDRLLDVFDLAADHGHVTWITEQVDKSAPWDESAPAARRIAAVVPVADAEYLETALRAGRHEALIDQVFRLIELHQVEQATFAGGRVTGQKCACGASWAVNGTSGLTGHWRDVAGKWVQGRVRLP